MDSILGRHPVGEKLKNQNSENKQRGTSDDFEVIGLILKDDPGLLRKVKERMTILRAMMKETPIEAAKKKFEQKKGW